MKKLFFSVFAFVICLNLQGQEIELPNLSPQSPNAFQFTKYGEVNVNDLDAPQSVEKILGIIFFNTANWPKSYFSATESTAVKVQNEHKGDHFTQSGHEIQRQHTPYYPAYMGFGW